ADGDPLTYSITSGPSHGVITSFNNTYGVFVYAPNPGYLGPDTFKFKANDGLADSDNTTNNNVITLNVVNNAPMVYDQVVNVSANTAATNLDLLHAFDS